MNVLWNTSGWCMCNRYFLSNRKQLGAITKRDDHYRSHLVMNMPWQLCLQFVLHQSMNLIDLSPFPPYGAKGTFHWSNACDFGLVPSSCFWQLEIIYRSFFLLLALHWPLDCINCPPIVSVVWTVNKWCIPERVYFVTIYMYIYNIILQAIILCTIDWYRKMVMYSVLLCFGECIRIALILEF